MHIIKLKMIPCLNISIEMVGIQLVVAIFPLSESFLHEVHKSKWLLTLRPH